jgi:hypothetical protein
MTAAESFAKFHTIVFGVEYMRSMITASGDSIDLARWYMLVPECYQNAVWIIITLLMPEYVSKKLTLDEFISHLHQKCCEFGSVLP